MIVLRIKNKIKNRRKHKIIIRSSFDNKKLYVIKFNDQEFSVLKEAAKLFNMDYQAMFKYIFVDLLSEDKRLEYEI